MAILIAILCSFLIAMAVYRNGVKNNHKKPVMTAIIVFILVLGSLSAFIFFLLDSMFPG
jgi:high-affinity Fe2+/Pb2+ permease